MLREFSSVAGFKQGTGVKHCKSPLSKTIWECTNR